MPSQQVRAAEILLNKALPDLGAMSIDASVSNAPTKESVLDAKSADEAQQILQ